MSASDLQKFVVVGALPGEGVGPALVAICRDILASTAERFGFSFDWAVGGPIGIEAVHASGVALSDEVFRFCGKIFERGGAILAGAGGSRFVYDMRRRFDLGIKLNPLRRYESLASTAPVVWRTNSPIDIMVVRENLGGLYQGHSQLHNDARGKRVEHRFECCEADVRRVIDKAAQLAARRRRALAVVAKQSGLPELSDLWFDVAKQSAARHDVTLSCLDIDLAAYQFVMNPEHFDVIATPNCFGDILADLGGVICGSRGVTYGGSFSDRGDAVYQTNHGAAFDLQGRDVANPAGQIFSLAMLLRESFGLDAAAEAIETAVTDCWSLGWRTADVMSEGSRQVGTEEFGDRVLEKLGGAA